MARRRLAVLLVLAAAACGGSDNARNSAGAGTPAIEVDSTPVAVSGLWPSELGEVLVVPSDTENLAVVLYPAMVTATLDPKTLLTLFGAGGDTIRARVGVTNTDTVHCGDAPLIALGRAIQTPWALGVSGPTARAVHSDSIESLTAADSLAYTVDASRMASSVTTANDSR